MKNQTPTATVETSAQNQNEGKTEKLSVEAFTILAIKTLRTPGKRGLHTVWSGFNDAFRKYFPNLNPIEETKRLKMEKKIDMHPVRGGVMIYLPGEGPSGNLPAEETLKKMGV